MVRVCGWDQPHSAIMVRLYSGSTHTHTCCNHSHCFPHPLILHSPSHPPLPSLILPSPSHPPLTLIHPYPLSFSPHPLILRSPSHPPLTLSFSPHSLIHPSPSHPCFTLILSFSFTHLTSYLPCTSPFPSPSPPPPLPLHRPRGSAVGERLWSPQDVTNTTDASIRLHNQRCRMVRYVNTGGSTTIHCFPFEREVQLT